MALTLPPKPLPTIRKSNASDAVDAGLRDDTGCSLFRRVSPGKPARPDDRVALQIARIACSVLVTAIQSKGVRLRSVICSTQARLTFSNASPRVAPDSEITLAPALLRSCAATCHCPA